MPCEDEAACLSIDDLYSGNRQVLKADELARGEQ